MATQGTTRFNPVPTDYTSYVRSGAVTASLPASYLTTLQADFPGQNKIPVYILLSQDTTDTITSNTLFSFADNNAVVTTVCRKSLNPVYAEDLQRAIKRVSRQRHGGQAIAKACFNVTLNAIVITDIIPKTTAPCPCYQ